MALDKNIIDSISNFATALEQLVKELKAQDEVKKKRTSIWEAIFGRSGTAQTMKRVEEGIKDIKKDTKEIIKNQKELIRLNKVKRKEENKNIIEGAGEKDQIDKIKSGVGTIILIAGAVLAIGMAFKLVAPVDVVSVLALGLAITMMGHTIAKLNDSKIPSPKDTLLIGLAILGFTTAAVASSWLLRLTAPVSLPQLITFGAILGTFSLFSFAMSSLIKSTEGMKPIQLLYLPGVLVGISLGIVASSHILQYTAIIPPIQLLNVLAIGMTMGLVALVMAVPLKMLSNSGKNMLGGALLAVVLLPTLSLGIVMSSFILNMVKPVDPSILGNVLLMGLTLGAVALVMSIPMLTLAKMGSKDILEAALLSVILLPALAAGITFSSWALLMYKPVNPGTLLNILMLGLTMSLVALVMSLPIMLLTKMGNMMDIIEGAVLSAILLPALAVGITLSSWVLQGYKPLDPSLMLNILMLGATLGLTALIMSIPLYIISKMGVSIIIGAAMAVIAFPLMSLGIMLSSWILSAGNYSNPMPISFAIGFSLAMLILAIPVAILGAVSLPIVAMGAAGLVLVAAAITASSHILALANPKGFEVIADAIAYFIKTVTPPIAIFMKILLPILAKGLKLMVKAVLVPLEKFMKGVLPALEKFFTGLLKGVFPIIKEVFDFLKTIVNSIDDVVRSIGEAIERASIIFPRIGKMFKLIGEGITKPIEAIGGVIQKVGDSIIGIINATVNGIRELSSMDPSKLRKVGEGLKIISEAIDAMTGGFWEGLGKKITNQTDPLTTMLKSMSEYGDGIDKVAKSLTELPTLLKELNKVEVSGESFERFVNGIDKLNNIDIDRQQMDEVINVLQRINNLDNLSANVNTTTRQILESTELIEELRSLNQPDNEELLQELRRINAQLIALNVTNTTISSTLETMRIEEPRDMGFNNN